MHLGSRWGDAMWLPNNIRRISKVLPRPFSMILGFYFDVSSERSILHFLPRRYHVYLLLRLDYELCKMTRLITISINPPS